jgi:hypothetical protein
VILFWEQIDPSHALEGGYEVGGVAAVDLEVSPKDAPGPGRGAKVDHCPGRGAKVDHRLDQKAGNLDQRANLSPSLIEALTHTLEADLRMSTRNLEAGLGLNLGPPKKMERVI